MQSVGAAPKKIRRETRRFEQEPPNPPAGQSAPGDGREEGFKKMPNCDGRFRLHDEDGVISAETATEGEPPRNT